MSRCPSCRAPREDSPRPSCSQCGWAVTLTDPGYIPARGGYVPGATAPPLPFKPLELLPEEVGWEQDDTPRLDAKPPRRPHPARLPETDPANIAWREKISAGSRIAAKDPDMIANRREGQLRRQRREARARGAA